ncbi:MAG: neutral/alkaline non-lysosomal ceramidase N-terminal domain-containing protein [Candidatus Hydrogenedentes bacterium]|nr:neutral/alkaline non-lysosomal ceramidase N-terminal domain-containing protein [Candidatus Hydrogenedentota bacterium]
MMRAGFATVDITPPAGTRKIGWLADLTGEVILDPLWARIAVFDNGATRLAFVQLDTLCVRWTHANDIRRRIEEAHGFPGRNIMVSATHNHAGPAVADCCPVECDDDYVERVTRDCVAAFGDALAAMQEVSIGCARAYNFDVPHNRRTVMRDGTVRSQTMSNLAEHPHLCLEGPIDPEVAVLAARNADGAIAGMLINFACHPTHHGGTNEFSGGFPARVCAEMAEAGHGIALYLNGAYGNVIHVDFERCISLTLDESADSVAASVAEALESMTFGPSDTLESQSTTLHLPRRTITDDEYHGRVRGAQRFRDDALYEGAIDGHIAKAAAEPLQPAEVQVQRIGDTCFVGVPGEYFVEYQLHLKAAAHPMNALIVGGANGMLGYIPTRDAFQRGGYETTLGPPSRMAPEAGELLFDAALTMVREPGTGKES